RPAAMPAAARGHRPIDRFPPGRRDRGGWVARLAALLALAIVGGFAAAALAQSAREAVGNAVERVYGARDYQTEMPREEPVEVFEPLKIPDIAAEIIRIVLITLLVVGGMLLLFFLANALPAVRERFKRRAAGRDQIGATPIAVD